LRVAEAADELLRLLDEAAEAVAGCGELGMFCPFDTGAALAAELRSLRDRLVRGDRSAVGPLVSIFAPTGAWDDGVGAGGMDLANRIMAALDAVRGCADPDASPDRC
jgi:hypothetical protein